MGLLLLYLDLFISCFSAVPAKYDLRDVYPHCTSLIKPLNQGSCGSCWAFSTTGVSSDHLCIGDYTTQYMAPEHSVQCDEGNNGCNGGYISRAFQFHVNSGLVPQSCKSYLGTSARRCSDKCDDGNTIEPTAVYNMLNYSRIHGSSQTATIELIKEAIYNRGSVAASFKVYEHFQSYYGLLNKKDVYTDAATPEDRGEFYTYHAIKIIGYNFEASQPYWIIQNSWGTGWADGGYFKLLATENSGNTEGLEGVLDILGDVYQPYIDPYKDECAQFSDCETCNKYSPSKYQSITLRNNREANSKPRHSSFFYSLRHRRNKKSNPVWQHYQSASDSAHLMNGTRTRNDEPQCAYCLSTDMCVSVDENNKPLRGMCETLAVTSNYTLERAREFETTDSSTSYRPCPLDDCTAYSSNPLQCVAQKGCHFCTQTNKCKKGSYGQQNSGTCLSPISTVAGFAQNSKYECLFKTATECKDDDSCGWCPTTQICLPVQSGATDCTPTIGSCYDDDGESQCTVGTASQNSIDRSDEEFCLHQPCNLCGATNNSKCKWCYTTESCLPDSASCSISSKTVKNHFASAEFPTQQFTRCSPCFNYSSCHDCAIHPQCGWLTSVSLCVPGIGSLDETSRSYLPSNYQKDEFIANKLECPVVYLDDADDDDASAQTRTNSTTIATQRV